MHFRANIDGSFVTIQTRDAMISCGGQGTIYGILSPSKFSDYCIKVYNDDESASSYKDKLEYMVANRPRDIELNKVRICWPQALVYSLEGSFVGYMMRLAFPGSRDLKILEVYTIGKTIAQKYPTNTDWHNKFEINNKQGYINRLKMLHNWALALEIIHSSGKYVLVDVKPENVLATSTGRISIVDTDSIQIVDNERVFRGPVATPAFFSKHSRSIETQNKLHSTYCDIFAFAVSCYKILTGTHPYSGFKLKSPYDTDEFCDISSHIEAELFPFGKNSKYIEFLASNNLHERFTKLPQEFQRLFIQTFTSQTGHAPAISVWRSHLSSLINGGPVSIKASPAISSSDNSEMKCLCVLVFDVSGSMIDCIDSVNRCVKSMFDGIKNGMNGFDASSRDIIELSIIQFDNEVKVLRKPALIGQKERCPSLSVRGEKTNTKGALYRALEIVEERKCQYKQKGVSYYRPWIILVTDGNPNPYSEDEYYSLKDDIKKGMDRHQYVLDIVGIGTKLNHELMTSLSDGHYHVIDKGGLNKFFRLLSASLDAIETMNGDDLLSGIESTINISV